MAGFVLAACGIAMGLPLAVHTPVAEAAARTSSGRVWVFQDHALRQVAGNEGARAVLATATTYDLVGAHGQDPEVPTVASRGFTSFAALSSAVRDRWLPLGTRALLYDNEHWEYTPLNEQRAVGKYQMLAVGIAHAHGLKLIVSPALDLVAVLAPTSKLSWPEMYLRLGLPQQAARSGADVLDLQAQSLEGNPAVYASFVARATAQAKAVNPRLLVLAGLSTGPSGVQVSSSTLPAAIRAVRSVPISGFWMNLPGNSGRCPSCTANPASLAVAAVVETR